MLLCHAGSTRELVLASLMVARLRALDVATQRQLQATAAYLPLLRLSLASDRLVGSKWKLHAARADIIGATALRRARRRLAWAFVDTELDGDVVRRAPPWPASSKHLLHSMQSYYIRPII
jgi:hypothetical protein